LGEAGDCLSLSLPGKSGRPDFLKQLAVKYKRASNKRWISKKNQTLKIYVFSTGNVIPEMKTTEKARKTTISDHITLLVKLIAKEAARSGEISMTCSNSRKIPWIPMG
jgi:alpha-D-ribose 1-methylphosphonate 5-triphosphate synthase subunit PhnL